MTGPLLIVNADDFGLTAGVCQAILRAGECGIVTSTSALANGPALTVAATALRDSGLGVGAHLALVGHQGPVLGAQEVPTLVDRRGEKDRNGRKLEVTQVALGDMIAAAAGLLTGEGAEGVPAVLIRGLRWDAEDRPAAALVRPVKEDLFR